MKTKGYHIGLLSPKCGRFPEECIVERWVGTINQVLKELEDPLMADIELDIIEHKIHRFRSVSVLVYLQ